MGKFGEGNAHSIMDGQLSGELIVAAAEVLHERVAGGDSSQRGDHLESAHRSQSCLEPAVVSLDTVVRVLLNDVARGREQVVEHARVDRRPVGGDLDRRQAVREGAGEEGPRRWGVAALETRKRR